MPLKTFQSRIGTTKMGMPMYDAIKSLAFQLPSRKTEKPETSVMTVDPTKPYQAVKGWNGPFHGSDARSTAWTLQPRWKRMKAKHRVPHAIKPATVERFLRDGEKVSLENRASSRTSSRETHWSHANAWLAPPEPRDRYASGPNAKAVRTAT